MLRLKILFRYQFFHLCCLNCLVSMLVWFLDAFNHLLILHPTVHVCNIKPSEAITVRHCATDSQFSCTYLRDSRSTVSLISLVSLTRFKAMPSMSYELVAGPDITCGSWIFSACRCWNIRCTGMQVNVTTPSLHLIGACLAIVVVFLSNCSHVASLIWLWYIWGESLPWFKSLVRSSLYLKPYRRVWFLGFRRRILWNYIWPRQPHMTSAHVMLWGHLQLPHFRLIEDGDMYASMINTYCIWYVLIYHFISTHI